MWVRMLTRYYLRASMSLVATRTNARLTMENQQVAAATEMVIPSPRSDNRHRWEDVMGFLGDRASGRPLPLKFRTG
jgi:hypothetical protein